jgi:hypothetical protein
MPIVIETDHKPLIPLLNSKHLDSLPPRVLRFRLRLMRFNYSVSFVPGTLLYTADTLSRSPQQSTASQEQQALRLEVQISAIASQLPTSPDSLEEYRQGQAADPVLSQVIKFCQTSWPTRNRVKGDLRPYWNIRSSLTYCNQLLLFGTRIVIPKNLQHTTLAKIHHGHQGIQKCRLRVSAAMWWPGISKEVEDYIQRCPICVQMTPQAREPLMPSPCTP